MSAPERRSRVTTEGMRVGGPSATVTVIGMDGSSLDAVAREAIDRATLLVGAARHLATVGAAPPTDVLLPPALTTEPSAGHAADVITLGPLAPAIERLAVHIGEAVVLASGDPGFFGIVRALRAAGLAPRVLPAVSSIAAAFARAGLNWDDALVVSAHGRDLRRAVNVCRAHPKVAVLTAPGSGPAELAAGLDDLDRRFVVAQRLGTPEEEVVTVGAIEAAVRQWADPHVVLVLDPARPDRTEPGWLAGAGAGPAGWALPESAFAHRDSMITKAEVRAFVLARLGPRLGELVWDVGCGSGSVAVECARFGAAVVAVDRDPAAVELTSVNAGSLGMRVVAGSAPECLDGLPDPDAVFVGGGGIDTLAACAKRRPRRIVTALAGLQRVDGALSTLEQAGYRADGVQLQAARLRGLPDGAHRLAAVNPVFVIWGEWS